MKLSEILNEVKQCLFPDDIRCMICGREITPNRYCVCGHCKLPINDNYCVRCGRHKVGLADYCRECAEQTLYFDEARSATDYTDNSCSLVRRLKYGASPYLARHMSEYLLDVLLVSDQKSGGSRGCAAS